MKGVLSVEFLYVNLHDDKCNDVNQLYKKQHSCIQTCSFVVLPLLFFRCSSAVLLSGCPSVNGVADAGGLLLLLVLCRCSKRHLSTLRLRTRRLSQANSLAFFQGEQQCARVCVLWRQQKLLRPDAFFSPTLLCACVCVCVRVQLL